MSPRPKFSAEQALERAHELVGKGTYRYGARDDEAPSLVFDCTSFAYRYCYGVPGHRPGFNTGWDVDWCTGATSTVEDDINSNSAIEDALHARDLYEVVVGPPRLGDLLAAPTIRIAGSDAGPWIGHGAIVSGIERAQYHWDPVRPTFALLDIIECRGPNGRNPAIRITNGTWFDERCHTWPKPQHRAWLLRVKP